MWFSAPDRIELVHGCIVINAATQFEVKRLQQSFGGALRQVVLQLLGNVEHLKFVVVSPPGSTAARGLAGPDGGSALQRTSETGGTVRGREGVAGSDPVPGENRRTSARPQRFRLADFAFSAGSEMLRTAVQEVLANPGRFSPLYVHGPAGSGKTHLAEAIAVEFRKRNSGNRAVCITAEHFTNTFIQSIRGGGLPMFRRKFRDLDLLVVDDIHFLGGKRATLGEFQYTLDFLVRSGKQVILTADRGPDETLDALGDQSSRMAAGLVCQIGWPDQAGREKIVRRMASERNLKLDNAAVELVSSRISGDARRLSGAVNRIIAATLPSGENPDPGLIHSAIGDLFCSADQKTSLAMIEQTICECFGVSVPELRAKRRTKRISIARMLAMFLARKYTTSALSEIGDFFGGRSHSTVVAAQKRIEELIAAGEMVEFAGRSCRLGDAVEQFRRRLQLA